MRSTGQPFAETDYGVTSVFEPGAWVCPAFSGDRVTGYFTHVGSPRFDCLDPHRTTRSAYGVRGVWNAAYEHVAFEERDPSCDRSSRFGRDARGRAFGLSGLASSVCVTRLGDVIHVDVTAAQGRWCCDDDGRQAPFIFYTAWLITTEASWPEDRARFQNFLGRMTIDPPPSPDGG